MQGASYTEVLEYMERHDKGMPDDPFGMKHASASEEAVKAGDGKNADDGSEHSKAESSSDQAAENSAAEKNSSEDDSAARPEKEDGTDTSDKE